MLEDHVEKYLRRWHTGCGFYGEQGGESIHKMINKKLVRYSNKRNPIEKLKYVMGDHLASVCPKARVKRVTKEKRNLKRNKTD